MGISSTGSSTEKALGEPACACVRACVCACVCACVLDGHRFGVREAAETVLLAALLRAEFVSHDDLEYEVGQDAHRWQTDGPRAT